MATKKFNLPQGGAVLYYRNYLGSQLATELFADLNKNIPWSQSDIKLYSNSYKTPRLQCVMVDNPDLSPETYSNTRIAWTPELARLRDKFSQEFTVNNRPLNYLLLNKYSDGNQYISYHADNEVIKDDDVIVSVSLGATRKFLIRPKNKDSLEKTISLELQHGDLVVMDGTMQRYYKHSVPKTTKKVGPRINLTFRRC